MTCHKEGERWIEREIKKARVKKDEKRIQFRYLGSDQLP